MNWKHAATLHDFTFNVTKMIIQVIFTGNFEFFLSTLFLHFLTLVSGDAETKYNFSNLNYAIRLKLTLLLSKL